MQAIVTKYHGPGNVRGSRIIAKADAGSIQFGYRHELNGEQNHKAAADALAKKLGWDTDAYGSLVGGGLPGNAGYAWVFVKSYVGE